MRLFITLFLFSSLADAELLPKPFNQTSHLLRNEPRCQEARCILAWIEDEKASRKGQELLNSNCSEFQSYLPTRSLISMFSQGKVQKELLVVYYQRAILYYCPDTCTVTNVGKMYWMYMSIQMGFARAYIDNSVIKALCPYPFDYCKWWGRIVPSMVFFALFALPTTIVLNSINISTLTKLISAHKTPAAALYFHKAEIYTDVCCSIVYYLWNNLWACWSLEFTLRTCFPASKSYISFYNFCFCLSNLLTFINQCTLYNLISDRCAALKDPLNYDSFNGRKNARRRQRKTIGFSVLFYTPLLLIYLFYPLVGFWSKQIYYLGNVVIVLPPLYALATFVCVVAQILRGIQYQKLYEEQLKTNLTTVANKAKAEEEEKIKKNEKEKRLLLVGTVGLNIVASGISMLLSVFESHFVMRAIGIKWWLNVLYVLSSLCTFVNGTGSFIIHVILLKPYRAAFWETTFGKIFYKIAFSKLFPNIKIEPAQVYSNNDS